MTEDLSGATGEPVLRFDRAEFAGGNEPARCAACNEPLADSYFDVNGAMTCASCRAGLEAASSLGSPATRFMRSLAAGVGAAAVGAGIYYGVRALTGGYEFGLIAILVGLMVGGAVRWGSHARGGWFYQALAIGLTYLSVVSTYAPFVVEAFSELDEETPAATAEAATTVPAAATTAASPAGTATAARAELAKDGIEKTTPAPPTAAELALGLGVIGFIFLAAPFLAGFENFMGWIILGIALYEAWKINRRRPLVISGPLQLARRPVEPTPV
jgi:hypothetical protein